MARFILSLVLFISTSSVSAEFFIVSKKSKSKITEEDANLAYSFLEKCEYFKKEYPIEYIKLDRIYFIIEAEKDVTDKNGYGYCGQAITQTNSIYIYPLAFSSEGCYSRRVIPTIIHEILHIVGLPNHVEPLDMENDKIEETVRQCYYRFTVD